MRRALLMLATVLVMGGLVDLAAGTAGADALQQQGWWTAANPGLPAGSGVVAPDVPEKGLLVQGGASSPSAFSALVFQVPDGATVGQMTLNVTANTVSTNSATLRICPLVETTIKPEQGGPMADAPKYDCARQTTAKATGSSYKFNIASLVDAGTLAVAVLPSGTTDRVVFDQPDANTLAIQPRAGASSGTSTSAENGTTSPGLSSGVIAPRSPITPSVTNAAAPPADSGAVAAPQTNASPARAAAPGFVSTRASSSSAANPRAVLMVVAGAVAGAALWLSARRAAMRGVMAEIA